MLSGLRLVAASLLAAGASGAALAGFPVASIAFGGQSAGTTSPTTAVTFTNTGAGTVTVGPVTLSNSQFSQSNDCTSLASGASCTINVAFSPAAIAGALGSTAAVTGTLAVATSPGTPATLGLSGTAEKSLVTHYYRAILRRAPDSAGKAFWEAEAIRVSEAGPNVNETWFAMAMSFFSSAEYLALQRSDAGFVTDLYRTFFNRAPDSGGLAYWTGLAGSGMPREVALVSFMFSAEFASFTAQLFGSTAARPEVDTVVDFYRGLLSRLPDDAGLAFWLQRFRDAQCEGSAPVVAEVEAISRAYVESAEYAARGRTNAQYVGDLYNAFLRRGGDLSGVQFWIGRLDSGAMTRAQLRQAFLGSPEFTGRVNAIIARGCAGRFLLRTRSIFAAFERRGWPNGYWSGDALRMFRQFDQQLANSIGAGNVAATVGAELAAQLDKKRAMGANAITFELRATDSFFAPDFSPPTCNIPPALGLLYPTPTAQELTGLRDLMDLVASKGMRVLLVLNNTNMEKAESSNASWLGPILDTVKGHPALDTVFFGGDKKVLDFGTPSCGVPAEPALWLGPTGYAAQYVKWAVAFAHARGLPWRQLTAEGIVGNYFVDRIQSHTIATLKQVFDELGIPANERTYGLSMYSHRRCRNPNQVQLPCTDADPDAWALETLQEIVGIVGAGSGARLVAAEYGDFRPVETGWTDPLAVESLTARMAQMGVEGGSYWIWTQTDAARDGDGALTGEAVRRRGLGDVYNPVRNELVAAYGFRLGSLPNGSFEEGGSTPSSWTLSGSGAANRFRLADEPGQPVIASRGSYALRLSTGPGANDAIRATTGLLGIAPRTRYTTTANLRFQWSGDAGSGSDPARPHVYLSVSYYDLAGNPSTIRAQDVARYFQQDGGPGFATFPMQYDAPADAHQARVEIGVMRNGHAAPLVVDVDNVR